MKSKDEIQKYLYNQFGLNAGYVVDNYEKYIQDSSSVSEYWQDYFIKLIEGNKDVSFQNKVRSQPPSEQKENSQRTELPTVTLSPEDKVKPIVGVGARIIQNMEESLTIPTATSQRTILVKL